MDNILQIDKSILRDHGVAVSSYLFMLIISYYPGTKVDIPSVMVFRDGVLTDVYNIKEDNYNIKKLEKYLEKEVVIND